MRHLQPNIPRLLLALALASNCWETGFGQEDAVPTTEEIAEGIKAAKGFERKDSNLRLGQIDFTFSGGVSHEYNDNIGLTTESRQADNITSPHLDIGMRWPLSQLNNLDTSFGLGYSKYWDHSELDSDNVLISPNSMMKFDIFIGDVHFTLHDQVGLLQDPSSVPQLSGLATFRRLTNLAGLDAEWDLTNAVTVEAGYTHDLFVSLEDRFASLDHATHTFSDKVGLKVAAPLTLGVQSSYFMTDYDQQVQNDSHGYTAGVFANEILNDNLRGNVSVSFQNTSFERGGTIGDSSDFQSVVYAFGLQNQLNRTTSHSLNVSRSAALGIGSNFTDIHELGYQVSAQLIKNISTSLGFAYQWYDDSGSPISEEGTRYTISPEIVYQIIQNVRMKLGYQRTERASSRVGGDYQQNRVVFDCTIDF